VVVPPPAGEAAKVTCHCGTYVPVTVVAADSPAMEGGEVEASLYCSPALLEVTGVV
jgi:hypothetical protein